MKIPDGFGEHDLSMDRCFDTSGSRHMADDTFTKHSLQGEHGINTNRGWDGQENNRTAHEVSAAQGLQDTYGASQIDRMTAHEAEREFRWFKNKD